ncbi:hypothetical protein KI387_024666, partial [Taxus chinensis]
RKFEDNFYLKQLRGIHLHVGLLLSGNQRESDNWKCYGVERSWEVQRSCCFLTKQSFHST